MDRNDLDIFEKLSGQLISIYDELSLLSKKSPNDAVNKFKLTFINKTIEESNTFLGKKYRPFDEFILFNSDDMPQNSDVVFIISQYIQSFEKYRADNSFLNYGSWYWRVKPMKGEKASDDGYVHVLTVKPKNLKG